MVPVDECSAGNKCHASSGCSNVLVISDDPSIVDANSTALVGVTAYVEARCRCNVLTFDHCTASSCLNGGTCRQLHNTFKLVGVHWSTLVTHAVWDLLFFCMFVCLFVRSITQQEGWLSQTKRASVSAVSLRHILASPGYAPVTIAVNAQYDWRTLKTNDPKVTWYREWPWYTLEVIWFCDSKVKGQGHRVNKCIFHTNVWSITQKRTIPKCSNVV